MASEDLADDCLPSVYVRQNSGNAVSLDFEPEANYQFVESLEERYKCTYCHLALHNPHQTGCGHRFCQHCIITLRYKLSYLFSKLLFYLCSNLFPIKRNPNLCVSW